MVQTLALKVGETINRRRVETISALKTWRKEVGSPFSFHVPAGWLKQELVPQFLHSGGRVAISHNSRRFRINNLDSSFCSAIFQYSCPKLLFQLDPATMTARRRS